MKNCDDELLITLHKARQNVGLTRALTLTHVGLSPTPYQGGERGKVVETAEEA